MPVTAQELETFSEYDAVLVSHHVAWIDISGPSAAAKLEFVNWLGFRFTDYLVLYKGENGWKISGKVYDSHAQN